MFIESGLDFISFLEMQYAHKGYDDKDPQLFSKLENLEISETGIVSRRGDVDDFTQFCHIDGYEVRSVSNILYGYVVFVPDEGFYFCRSNSPIAKELIERKEEEKEISAKLSKIRSLPNFSSPIGQEKSRPIRTYNHRSS